MGLDCVVGAGIGASNPQKGGRTTAYTPIPCSISELAFDHGNCVPVGFGFFAFGFGCADNLDRLVCSALSNADRNRDDFVSEFSAYYSVVAGR